MSRKREAPVDPGGDPSRDGVSLLKLDRGDMATGFLDLMGADILTGPREAGQIYIYHCLSSLFLGKMGWRRPLIGREPSMRSWQANADARDGGPGVTPSNLDVEDLQASLSVGH